MIDRPFWKTIAENNYAVPQGHTLDSLTDELLAMLGSVDGEVRDDIAYNTFSQWIVAAPQYSDEELRRLRDKLLKNLKNGIEEGESDKVFLRSFSVLTLGLVIYHDNTRHFLEMAEVKDMLDQTLHYFAQEKDLRGYIEVKGWAHSCAHTADMLKFLARSRHIDGSDHKRMLNAIADKLSAPTRYIYVHGEDDRLSLVILDILRRGLLSVPVYESWLEKLGKVSELEKAGAPFDSRVYGAIQNTRSFLRSLFFRMELGVKETPPLWDDIQPLVLEAIKAI